MRALIYVDRCIGTACKLALVCCIFLIISLALLGIILRWWGTGWPWIDPLVQHLVFLSAFLGGAVATEKGSHIAIDIGARSLEAKQKWGLYRLHKRFILLICFLGLIWLIVVSCQLTSLEWKYGRANFLGYSQWGSCFSDSCGICTYCVAVFNSTFPSCKTSVLLWKFLVISSSFFWPILGTPLFIVMSLLGLSAYFFAGTSGASMAVEIYRMAGNPTLLSIPLFTFAGSLMAKSGSPKRLFTFGPSRSWMVAGWGWPLYPLSSVLFLPLLQVPVGSPLLL